ncbi:MAG: hypothetical protein DRI26_06100 [Chloroflexi bacterium]|nr:MAG: hypothetical protein DRI26_06100 [Chloroflexota bacterium]
MKVEEKIKALEDELKLIKGELKQTLVDVREFLQNLKTPPPGREDVPQIEDVDSSGGDGSSPTNLTVEESGRAPQRYIPPIKETVSQVAPGATFVPPGPEPRSPDLPPPVTSKPEPGKESEGRQPQERKQPEDAASEMGQPVPQVNLLANLIRWVSAARREVGHEQLATFLDVYGISGHLCPEVREVILQLAEVTAEELAERDAADVWSRLLLELHGILSGGGTPLRSLRTSSEAEAGNGLEEPESSASQASDRPIKLKLVLPLEEGEREFTLTLAPDTGKETETPNAG